jgi:hypothetical protein
MRGLTWQRCPNAACANDAWKPDNHCNRMICKCGRNFCFLCGADITEVRYEHYNDPGRHPGCRYRTWHVPLVAGGGKCKCNACRKGLA